MHELTIIVPTHQTRELTLRCLASVLAADPAGAEVLVVDDASTDGTAETVAARHPAVRVLRNATRRGFAASANRGVTEAGGELVLLLNSDTELAAGALPALAAAFAADPRLGVAGGHLVYPCGRTQWSAGREPGLAWFFVLGSGCGPALSRLRLDRRLAGALSRRPPGAPRPAGWVTGAALAVRRAAWREAGGFDEGFAFYAQDLDLCVRCRQAGWRVAVVPGLRVVHHHGATIGRLRPAGQVHRQQPDLLWRDLLRWAGRRRGAGWARRAAALLRLGVGLRVAARRLAAPLLPPGRRAGWRADTAALRASLAGIAVGR